MNTTKSQNLIGYMRVSTKKQDTQLQYDALVANGVHPDNIYKDVISGKSTTREGLDKCLASLKPGDVLVVWRLDRLGRSIGHLVSLIEGFRNKGIGFKSLMDPIDTTSASGELVFHMFAALAHFERALAQERIKAGIKAVMDGGRETWGKTPGAYYTAAEIEDLHAQGYSCRQIASMIGISKDTVSRSLKRGQTSKISNFI